MNKDGISVYSSMLDNLGAIVVVVVRGGGGCEIVLMLLGDG